MTFDEILDTIELKIVELENNNWTDYRIQELLDMEADLILQDYYHSKECYDVCAWDSGDNLWLDE